MVDKPEGATHLQGAKPEDGTIEPAANDTPLLGKVTVPNPVADFIASPNYTPGWPAGAPQGITIHTMEGYFDASVSWLCNPNAYASAHFCVRRDGHITQLVSESDRAWHAKDAGMYYFGIEHEGSGAGASGVPVYWTTPKGADRLRSDDAMLKSSAKLSAYLCQKYNIPVQHDFTLPVRRDTTSWIAGHDQMQGNDHVDPQGNFPWKAYINEIKALLGNNPTPAPTPGTIYRVQAGSFKTRANADAFALLLKAKGYTAAVISAAGLYKVQVGAYASRQSADALVAKLKADGFSAVVVPGKAPAPAPKPTPKPGPKAMPTADDIVAAALELVGAPYRIWTPGDPIPLWLNDGAGDPPSAAHLMNVGADCADVIDYALMRNGLPSGGGTGSFASYLIQQVPFNPNTLGIPGAIAYIPYMGSGVNQQGHIAMYIEVGHTLVQALIFDTSTLQPGVTTAYTDLETYSWGGDTAFTTYALLPGVDYSKYL